MIDWLKAVLGIADDTEKFVTLTDPMPEPEAEMWAQRLRAVGIGAALNKLRSSRNNLVNNEELSSLENSSNPNTLNSKDFNDHTGSMDEDVEDLIDGIFDLIIFT